MIIVGNAYSGLNSSSSGMVITDSGVSGNGTSGSPVILGGNALIQNTIIDSAGFDVTIGDPNFVLGNIFIGAHEVGIQCGDPTSAPNALIQVVDGSANVAAGDGVNSKELDLTYDSGGGIFVVDAIDLIGLFSNTDFTNPILPGQYMQRYALGAFLNEDTSVFSTTAPAAGSTAYVLNSCIFVNNAVGLDSTLTLNYTDILGNPHAVLLGTVAGAGPNPFSTHTFIAEAGTDITIIAAGSDSITTGGNCMPLISQLPT